MKAVIVDDEILILRLIKEALLKESGVRIVGEYTNPRKALDEIPDVQPDLVFLDIDMPGMNGIELATQILNHMESVGIVFVTAYDQYAVQAFRLNAIHYILKPPAQDDIRQVLSRARSDAPVRPIPSADEVTVQFLGGVQVRLRNGPVVKWVTAKTEELFALFVLNGANGMDKWQIIDRLWPNAQDGKSEQLLYTTVYRLKKTLLEYGIKASVSNSLGRYRMNLEHMRCDVHEFEAFYKKQKDTPDLCGDQLDALNALYRGALLDTRDYEWCALYRQELSRKFTELLALLATRYKDAQDPHGIDERQPR